MGLRLNPKEDKAVPSLVIPMATRSSCFLYRALLLGLALCVCQHLRPAPSGVLSSLQFFLAARSWILGSHRPLLGESRWGPLQNPFGILAPGGVGQDQLVCVGGAVCVSFSLFHPVFTRLFGCFLPWGSQLLVVCGLVQHVVFQAARSDESMGVVHSPWLGAEPRRGHEIGALAEFHAVSFHLVDGDSPLDLGREAAEELNLPARQGWVACRPVFEYLPEIEVFRRI